MKNKITKYYNDIFTDDKPEILLTSTRLFFHVNEGEKYTGSFDIESANQTPVRGIVYSESYRMECKKKGFEGISSKITFEFNSKGLKEGDIYRGYFTIACLVGEYRVYYTACVLPTHVNSSIGKISNIKDFVNLYMHNHTEAYSLFYSSNFSNVINREDISIKMITSIIKANKVEANILEEFLVGIGQKKPVTFLFTENERYYNDISTYVVDSITLRKNGWGYLELELYSDCDFIELDNKRITTDNFEDNVYNIPYKIDYQKLNKGINEGNIFLKINNDEISFKIIIENSVNKSALENNKFIKSKTFDLINLYLKYRAGMIEKNEYQNKSIKHINDLIYKNDNSYTFEIIKSYIYYISDNLVEAKRSRDYIKGQLLSGKNREILLFKKYIDSQIKNDLAYKIKVLDEIKKEYEINKDNVNLLWIIINNDDYYIQNADAKLKILKKKYENGVSNYLTMLDSYLLIKDQPNLLEKIDDYKINVLIFALRKKLIDIETINKISFYLLNYKEYSYKYFNLLQTFYEYTKSKDILNQICRYLITNSRVDSSSFKWYERAINEKLRITNLYEYFLYSLDDKKPLKLDSSFYLYFSKTNILNVKKKAFLYANLIREKKRYPEILESMEDEISIFALDQFSKKNIDSNLKYLYKYFLSKWEINKINPDALAELLFTKEIIITDEKIANVIILYKDLTKVEKYKVDDYYAYVKIFSSQDRVLLEDKGGHIYINTIDYSVNNILPLQDYYDFIVSKNSHYIGTLIETYNNHLVNKTNYGLYELFTEGNEIREESKNDAKKKMLKYYYDTFDKNSVKRIIQEVSIDLFSAEEKNELINILIELKEFKRVKSIIDEYGYDFIKLEFLFNYIVNTIDTREDKPEDIFVSACYHLVKNNLYNKEILMLLNNCFVSSTNEMIEVWKKSLDEKIDTKELEERIIIQMLFTERFDNDIEIFDSYYKNNPNNNIKKAYISYKANKYLIRNIFLDYKIIEYIEKDYLSGDELNDSEQLAYLKYFSNSKLDEDKVQIASSFLINLKTKGYNFTFFDKYYDTLDNNNDILKTTLIQYHTNNNAKVFICYKISSNNNIPKEYTKESLILSYNSYYQKEFILFKDEKLYYYIVEENDANSQVTEVGIKEATDLQSDLGKYNYINSLIDSDNPEIMLDDYERKNYLSNQLFKII